MTVCVMYKKHYKEPIVQRVWHSFHFQSLYISQSSLIAEKMKKEIILISVFLGVFSSAMVAESLKLQQSQFSDNFNPCPDNFTGNVANPDDCHSFYICHEGRGEVFTCGDLCYNPSIDQCDFCDNVPGCGGSVTRPPTSTPPTTVPTPPPTTTSTSTTTTTTTSTTTTTPTTTTPPPPTTSTSPSPDPTTSPSTEPPTNPTTTQTSTTQGGGGELPCPELPFIYMPYPGDCTKFYYCENGSQKGDVYQCGIGLWFHFTMQACVVPWGSSCN